MISYRRFRNSDPPQLLRLWHECDLGRGAAKDLAIDALDILALSQPYFDPEGLIVAVDDGKIVGYVHAGFGCNATKTDIDHTVGVICVLLVLPSHRRQGIGTELLRRGEWYLKEAGAKAIHAGPSRDKDPFYVGVYGGTRCSGFLHSDPIAFPFFIARGYGPVENHAIFQRNLRQRKDPLNFRLVTLRRKMELQVSDLPQSVSWWWHARYGKLDTVSFQLLNKGSTEPIAGLTVVGLDLYISSWQERCVGFFDLQVEENERRKGYGQLLLTEVCKRMREELVTTTEVHVNMKLDHVMKLVKASGFEQVDQGTVFLKQEEEVN